MFEQPPEGTVAPVMCNLNLTSFPPASQDLGKLQREDAKLATVIAKLESGEQVSRYHLDTGILYSNPGRKSKPKVVLPAAAVSMVFTYFHESLVGSHLGVNKMINKLGTYFFWEAMNRDIHQRVRACHLCGLSKPAQNSKLGLLMSEVA
jgi:hypothetical protein